MKEKKDIFNGNIKKEYFSYILGYMIFWSVSCVALGAVLIYASLWGMTTNTMTDRVLVAALGVIVFAAAIASVVLQLLVIRNFPKHPKLRRIMFNSDIYFTNSTSMEYFGVRTRRGRWNKAAFDWVTAFAEAERAMGDRKPAQYKIYSALATCMAALGLVYMFGLLILRANGIMLLDVPDGVFAFCLIAGAAICVVLAVLFLKRALEIAVMAPIENDKWRYDLYVALVDIAVRKNNKKLKFWYEKEQVAQIKNVVQATSRDVEIKLTTKRDKLISFEVVDAANGRVLFTGYFM